MYNLLMVGADNYWSGGSGRVDTDRYLEHTVKPIKADLENVTDEVIEKLKAIPSLFAYEKGCEANAQVGWIEDIKRKSSELEVSFSFDTRIAPIPPEQFQSLLSALDIEPKFEIHRTHWAVKDVDLFAILASAGIVDPALLARPKQGSERQRVFIVHGRHDASKEAVARWLDRLGLEPVILHEEANRGRTIISKFRDVAADAAFALVLMTPDDIGGLAGSDKTSARARQNVVFELGFFLGTLGPERVCALIAGDIDIPSDYEGVLYVKLDDAGGWKLSVAKELSAAGVVFDTSKLI